MSSSGVYGTRVPARVNPQTDIEIFYNYRPTRGEDSTINNTFIKLDSALLTQAIIQSNEPESANIKAFDTGMELEGMYNLKLPLNYFNQKGFYTVYIKPKEVIMTLQDVGVLASYEDIKGIVIDSSLVQDTNMQSLLRTNNALIGYRVIYFDSNSKREPYYRLVTSNNKCEPVVQNTANVNTKSIRYRYNESSSLVFLTLTPSVASTFKPNALPYIGRSMQRVALVNTKFEPVMLDIEMVENDMDTLSIMMNGSQLRNLENGLVTTFNNNNEIFAQHEHFTLKDSMTNDPIFEVKHNKQNSIDFSQTIEYKIQ